MKTIKTLLFLIALSLTIVYCNDIASIVVEEIEADEDGTWTLEEWKQAFQQNTNWQNQKDVIIKLATDANVKNEIFSNNQVQPDFVSNNKLSTSQIIQKNSLIKPEQFVVPIMVMTVANKTLSLDDFILEFEAENPDNVQILSSEKKQPILLIEMHDHTQQIAKKKRKIEQNGFIEKIDIGNLVQFTKRFDQEHLLIGCVENNGYEKIIGKYHPIYDQSPENTIEFALYKDCRLPETNKYLKVDTVHYCHHHNINEVDTIFENGDYSNEYVKHKETPGYIKLEHVDPQIKVSATFGNQFISNPKILKKSGPKSTNRVDVKQNKIGGLVTVQQPITFQITEHCEQNVGKERWEFSFDLLPFADPISILFETSCEDSSVIQSADDFPLIIGTEQQKYDVVKWGKVLSEFAQSPENKSDDLEEPVIPIVYDSKQRIATFHYGITKDVSDPSEILEIQAHNPTVYAFDHTIVRVLHQQVGKVVTSDDEDQYLQIHLRCLKQGRTYIEVHQAFEYQKEGVKKQVVEYGFYKECKGFDYDYYQDDDDDNNNLTFVVIIAIVIVLIIFALFLIKSGVESDNSKRNTSLPVSKNQEMQGLQQRNRISEE